MFTKFNSLTLGKSNDLPVSASLSILCKGLTFFASRSPFNHFKNGTTYSGYTCKIPQNYEAMLKTELFQGFSFFKKRTLIFKVHKSIGHTYENIYSVLLGTLMKYIQCTHPTSIPSVRDEVLFYTSALAPYAAFAHVTCFLPFKRQGKNKSGKQKSL